MDEEFGAVTAGDITDVFELKANMNQNAVHEFNVKVIPEHQVLHLQMNPNDNIFSLLTTNGSSCFLCYCQNEYMGFADFRAAFTADTGAGWSVDPPEGSLSKKEDTNFIVRFKPNAPGVSEGYLVVETEDFKKTWKVIGTTA